MVPGPAAVGPDRARRSCHEHIDQRPTGRRGIVAEIVVHGNAPGCSFANRTNSYKRFADFMAFVVKRYSYVRYWEPWNEMDSGFTAWSWTTTDSALCAVTA